MKDHPILFSGAMVRALLDGSKTQTRRVVKMPPSWDCFVCADWGDGWWPYRSDDGESPNYDNNETPMRCPYGQPGDRLWVRETFLDTQGTGVEHRDEQGNRQRFAYAAETAPGSYGDAARKDYGLKWKPSIHMPRAASRILLEVVSVRAERLRDCSKKDAIAEGIHCYEHSWRDAEYPLDDVAYEPVKGWPLRYSCPVQAYQALWESINGAGSWDSNPWVWVVEFKRVAP